MIRERRVSPFVFCAAVLALACGQGSRPHLPALTQDYAHVDNTVTFELPDSGGFLANGVPVPRARIAPLLREVFADRNANLRAVFVVDNPSRDWSDVEVIEGSARTAGGQAFDAKLSGRLPLRDWTEIRPVERH